MQQTTKAIILSMPVKRIDGTTIHTLHITVISHHIQMLSWLWYWWWC